MFAILWLKSFSYKRRNFLFQILVHPDTNLHEQKLSPDLIFLNLFKISLAVFFQMIFLLENEEKKSYEDRVFVHQEPSNLKKIKFYNIFQSGKNQEC